MQELMLLSFSFSQSLGSRIRRYRGDPNAGNFSGRGEHRALGRTYIYRIHFSGPCRPEQIFTCVHFPSAWFLK